MASSVAPVNSFWCESALDYTNFALISSFYGLFSPNCAAYKQCELLVTIHLCFASGVHPVYFSMLSSSLCVVGPVFAGFSRSSGLDTYSCCNHAYRDVYTEISSSRMFSRYTVDLHGHRKFKYLFISLATMCYTCSQLQNCPVETRQHRHIQCKSFPSWPPGVDSCC